MATEVLTITVEIRQTHGEAGLYKLFRQAIADVKHDRTTPAGLHVTSTGYYRVIESTTDDD